VFTVTYTDTPQNIDYMSEQEKAEAAAADSEEEPAPPTPIKIDKRKKKKRTDDESDTDFQVDSGEDTEVEFEAPEGEVQQELKDPNQQNKVSGLAKQSTAKPKGDEQLRIPGQPIALPPQASPVKPPKKSSGKPSISSKPSVTVIKVNKTTTTTPSKKDAKEPTDISLISPPPSPKLTSASVKPFVRANLPIRNPFEPANPNVHICRACHNNHPIGACDLKAAGVEYCGLCGLAHYGHGRTCPHIKSETQVREMLAALKNSPEKKELIDLAAKYLRGVKGALVQQKKRDREKAEGRGQNISNTNAAVAAATGFRAPLSMSAAPLSMSAGPLSMSAGPLSMSAGPLSMSAGPLSMSAAPPTGVPAGAVANQYPKQVQYGTYQPPMQQNGHVPQRAYPQAGQVGRPAGHAEGQFDERDVENALRGFLGQ
jgi:chromodomain-helicase-DNA-binding protein 4